MLADLTHDAVGIMRRHGPIAALRDTLALTLITLGYLAATRRYRDLLNDEYT